MVTGKKMKESNRQTRCAGCATLAMIQYMLCSMQAGTLLQSEGGAHHYKTGIFCSREFNKDDLKILSALKPYLAGQIPIP